MALLFALTFTNCTPKYYTPTAHNVPMLEKKGDLRLSGHISFGDEAEAIELQGAIAISEKIGVMANGYFLDLDAAKADYGEVGLGYFTTFREHIIFEMYGGYGIGHVRNKYFGNSSDYSNLRLGRFFIQPSLGFSLDWMDMALSPRVSWLNYTDIQARSATNEIHPDVQFIRDNPFSLLFEPAITLRFGWKNVKFQYQVGWSFNQTNPALPQENINMNIGAFVRLRTQKEK